MAEPITGEADTNAGGERPPGRRRVPDFAPLRVVWGYAMGHPAMLALAGCALVLSAAITLAFPIGVRGVVDHGFGASGAGEAAVAQINTYFGLIAALGLGIAVTSALRFYTVTWIGERIVAELRADVFRNLAHLSPAFFDTIKSGEVLSRLNADTTQIKAAASTVVSQSLRNLLLLVGGLAMMVATAPGLAALLLIIIPAVVVPIVLFGRKVRERSREAQDTLGEASAYAQENLTATRVMQAFNAQGRVHARYAAAVEDAFEAANRRTFARAMLTGGAISVVFVSIVGILWYGATLVASGAMSAGLLSQFVLYAIFAAAGLGNLSELWGELQQTAGAAERLVELLKARSPIRQPAVPQPLPEPARGAIAFETVSFAYPGAPDPGVLQDVSFRIEPGETVAIVGPSGAGKSTLFALLLRYYDPDNGAVRIDGVNVREADLAAVRARFGVVPQDVQVFAGSVAENIGYGRPDASRADVEAAARMADAHGFIVDLPQGYDTILGERGITLSGGQRQRVALARALMMHAPILLLDEATSALDAQSEGLVQAALARIAGRQTTLVIAHRLATVRSADRILVFDGGRLVASGTHSDLMADNGLYADLARSQFLDHETLGDGPVRPTGDPLNRRNGSSEQHGGNRQGVCLST